MCLVERKVGQDNQSVIINSKSRRYTWQTFGVWQCLLLNFEGETPSWVVSN